MQEVISTNKLAAFRANLASTSVAFPDDKVSAAFEFLNETDFPTTRHENWKYTRTSLVSGKKWEFSDDKSIPELPLNLSDFKNRIVLTIFYNN
jgi:hypothetical protein